jgi:tight adherence protein C
MTRQVLLLMAMIFALFIIAGTALNRRLHHDAVLAARVRGVQRSVGIETVIAPAGTSQTRLLSLVAGVGEAITRAGLLSASTLEELQARLSTAGLRGRNALAAFVGAKLLALGGLPPLCWIAVSRTAWSPTVRFAAIAGAGVAGLLLPDYVVRTLHKRHLKAVEQGLPDALDMLVICSEAGLGLEPAIERVGREIGHAHQDVADELLNVAREMRVNADRHAALMNMGTRTGLASLQRLGVTLVQTLQYGTPLSQALQTLSAEMRQEALTRFEARAGRLPSLLTVPMIVFILPCVFLIVGGPAVVHIMQLMRQ